MASDQATRIDVLRALLMHAVSYHNHKELMAYAATTLYVPAAAAVAFSSEVWNGLKPARAWVVIGIVIGAGGITMRFVAWQLSNRADAARRVADSMNELVAAAELQKEKYGADPAALDVPEALTYAVLIASMLLTVIVVLATC